MTTKTFLNRFKTLDALEQQIENAVATGRLTLNQSIELADAEIDPLFDTLIEQWNAATAERDEREAEQQPNYGPNDIGRRAPTDAYFVA